MTRNGRKMCIFIATTRLGDSDFIYRGSLPNLTFGPGKPLIFSKNDFLLILFHHCDLGTAFFGPKILSVKHLENFEKSQ